MINSNIRNKDFPTCPVRNILCRISSKWSLLVIHSLAQQPCMRFNALQKEMPDISQKMLTSTLRILEEDGLVQRTVYAEVPPRVEYALTERGNSLLPCLSGLVNWALENMDNILQDRQQHAGLK